MTATALAEASGFEIDDEQLTDDQIEQLLEDVASRLTSPASNLGTSTELECLSSLFKTSAKSSRSTSKLSQLQTGGVPKPYVALEKGIAQTDASRLVNSQDQQLTTQIRRVGDPVQVKRKAVKELSATAGSDWFNLPRTNLTPELKRDLQLLKMRSVLDPHRHYKKENARSLVAEFSQIGTVIEGPTEFYSARILNRDRKRTFVDEILAGEDAKGRFKSKYSDLQAVKTSGKKAHYKILKEKRSKASRR